MKKLLALIIMFGFVGHASAAFPPALVSQGGTGLNFVNSGYLLIGSTTLRLATSSNLFYSTSTSALNVLNFLATGSTTLQAFSGINFTALGSTTLQNFTAVNGTTTQATTTNLAISSLSAQIPYAFPGGSIGALTIGSGLSLTNGTLSNSAQPTFAWPFTKQADGVQATSTTMGFFGGFLSLASSTNIALFTTSNLLVNGSSTLQNFTGQNATTTNFNIGSGSITAGSSNPAGYITATTSPSLFIASTTKGIENRGYGAGTTTISIGRYRETRIIRSLACFATSSSPSGYLLRFRAGDTFSSTYFCDNSNQQVAVGFTVPANTQLYSVFGPASTTADYAGPTWDLNKLSP